MPMGPDIRTAIAAAIAAGDDSLLAQWAAHLGMGSSALTELVTCLTP